MSIETALVSAAAAIAAGLIGCFAVMRRMTLAADALSHVALPGIAIAIALGLHPLVGALTMLVFGALLVWAIEDRARVGVETIVGVVFTAALAAGAMLSSGDDLIDALFGRPQALSAFEAVFGVAASAAVAAFVLAKKNDLVVTLISPDIARTTGINVRRLNLIYLQLFALTIALGLRYLGVLLMGALVIIPAATAKRLSRTLQAMFITAATLAAAATLSGTWLAVRAGRDTGPAIVAVAAAAFFLSLLKRQVR